MSVPSRVAENTHEKKYRNKIDKLLPTRYFEDDEEESSSNVDLPYIPAENSPTRLQMKSGGGSDSDDDPLDAFMAEVEVSMIRYLLSLCSGAGCFVTFID